MEKIDRLGWAADLAFNSYGLTLGIRTNTPALLEQIAERLPPGWSPTAAGPVERLYSLLVGGPGRGSAVRRFNLLYVNEMRLARSLGLPEILKALETDLELYVAERARRRLFVHAGVVGWQGRAIVIPGVSMSGKSSLVAALVRAGATYYSDEYAVLDARGRVHPYPRALSLRDGPGGATREMPTGRVEASLALEPLPVGLVLITRYRSGARWRPQRLSPGRTGIELLAHALAARRRPARTLAMLAHALRGSGALKGIRGEAAELAEALLGDAQPTSAGAGLAPWRRLAEVPA